jgi:hypothetical protein
LALNLGNVALAAEQAAPLWTPAAPEPAAPLDAESRRLIELATQHFLAGDLAGALRQLDQVRLTPESKPEVLFLRAQFAELGGDLDGAVAYYRDILGDRPDLVRVRLELARVLFRLGEDDAARHHFDLARGANPPPAVQQNIERFLAAIHARRRLRFNFGFSLVPDTNVNSATDSTYANLFGAPFQLSDDAKRNSGIGASVVGGVDYYQPLQPGLNLETGASARHLEHSGSTFDDTNIYGYVGLRRYLGLTDVGLRATGARRWFGGDGYSYALGGRLDVGHRLSPQWSGRLSLGWENVDYDTSDFLDGELYQFQSEASYALSADSRLQFFAGSLYEDTADSAYTNVSPYIGLQYLKEFPNRLTAGLQPLVLFRQFDDPIAAFGETRQDWSIHMRATLTYRTDLLYGFAPVLTYTYTYNHSNIEIYGYDRHRFEIGLTKEF